MTMQVRYYAKRSLIPESPTHVADTQYTTTIVLTRQDRNSGANRTDVESLRGDVFSTIFNRKDEWRCQHKPVQGASANLLREFLDSVIGGEVFEIDFDDGQGWRNVYLKDKRYAERRAIRLGDGGGNDYMSFGWVCRAR